METMQALGMSKSQCQATYLNEHRQPYDKIIVGAIILKNDSAPDSDILLLKRAAHEDLYPNVFEIPGGHMGDHDETVLDALKREVMEETRMSITKVVRTVKPFSYTTEKKVTAEGHEELSV